MIRLEVKNFKKILTKKLQKYQYYQQVKLLNMISYSLRNITI